MCGIFCCIPAWKESNHYCLENEVLYTVLRNRGPDAEKILNISDGTFAGFVLWHQGTEICFQPIVPDNIILLFNGDIFKTNSKELKNESDSDWLSTQLENCQSDKLLINFFKELEGPFSIIMYNKYSKDLYFARDSMGRNSLIVEKNKEHLCILSVASLSNKNAIELPPLGIFKLNIEDSDNWTLFPWVSLDRDQNDYIRVMEGTFNINIKCQYIIESPWLHSPAFAKEFSFNFYDMVKNLDVPVQELFSALLKNDEIVGALDMFSALLNESVKSRVQTTTGYCRNCISNREFCNHSKVAILYSGGIDCSVLAVLTDKYIDKSDSIDLINVAFEAINSSEQTWDVPDRLSARSSYEELKLLCPRRKWNFIEVNVTRKELLDKLSTHLKHLIYPLNTILDESIGSAFWFAAQGKGYVDQREWTSTARVVILGSGADELFGGYMRHRKAYTQCQGDDTAKQLNVHKEMERDWKRIFSRNLARDDRVISDTGKTPRSPFIEEHVVQFVRSLKSSQRCCFLVSGDNGSKLFLRLYAQHLGLTFSTFLRKRAIQFGSKIANKNQKATDTSAYIK
ncbi:asparagine synthetase domain-containing protein CG17486 [Glossina fuscipes]|uniref:Asparagine synthetase domain-containing protein CG17486 n=1 Tax=Glossina fuscipes TaxID=7396 RepID=A0A8U0WCR6_9MUSC|nr:asparagine synthetase domain-containing protein CG17486 [Glossina fuscipes]